MLHHETSDYRHPGTLLCWIGEVLFLPASLFIDQPNIFLAFRGQLVYFNNYAGDGSNRGPPRFVHKATPARLMRRARSSRNYHRRRMGAIDAVNEWRLPKVSEGDDEAMDQKDWQADTVSSRISSGIGLNLLRPLSSSAKHELGQFCMLQLVIGTLMPMVPMREAIRVVMLLTIRMARIVQLQCKGWRDAFKALR